MISAAFACRPGDVVRATARRRSNTRGRGVDAGQLHLARALVRRLVDRRSWRARRPRSRFRALWVGKCPLEDGGNVGD
jgi:hypothetical protein